MKGEEGYVLVLTALLLLPLLAVTGLAVDLGAWYARAAAIQRAADAAALAGVVYLPDMGAATTRAEAIASANGFTESADINVEVTQIGGSDAKLQVSITDNSAEQFFTGTFTSNVDITRSSTAEYVRPVPMGSPKNFLGTGDRLTGANRENYWLAISGGCSSKEQGDLVATKTDANYSSGANPPATPAGRRAPVATRSRTPTTPPMATSTRRVPAAITARSPSSCTTRRTATDRSRATAPTVGRRSTPPTR